MMNKRDKMNADYAKANARLGNTTGASKGAAKVSAKPAIKASGTNPLKKKIGVKATWKF